ncbi:ABC-F family ATP-binding cassette domain-containing protein [Longispora sp. NPDC051575]|uniref:ABC-F family ATP-binding cassette domain-containing protein n=1 Tax=Longispora sp. NPDC051575 TaxID=3154943 RepID=UPI003439D323
MSVLLPHAQLAVHEVSHAYAEHVVLADVSFTIRPGERVAVIGENGSGKSTLLRLLAGREPADAGQVTVVAPGGVGHLGQLLDLRPDQTVRDAMDDALADLRRLESELRAAERDLTEDTLAAYGDLLAAFEARGGYEAEARLDAARNALGVGDLGADRPLGSLSGGEQARLALACVLAADPELLLLDEPTNHLDAAGAAWLADQLRAHRGTVVVVTHDRTYLDAATVILEVDGDRHTVRRHGDGWAGYLAAHAADRRRWQAEYDDWVRESHRQAELAESGVDEMRRRVWKPNVKRTSGHRRDHQGGLSAQVRKARAQARRLTEHPVPRPPDPLRFAARFDGAPTEPVEVTDLVVGDRLALPGLRIEPGGRLLVTGPNGAGKTTLLRALAGDLVPDRGTVSRPARLGWLRQEVTPGPARRTALAAFAEGLPGTPDEHAGTFAALGLLPEELFARPVAWLSIGQRRRVELARLVSRPADLLILDEPTNHLSLALVEELGAAIGAFAGTVVAVSHDPRFGEAGGWARLELRHGRPV